MSISGRIRGAWSALTMPQQRAADTANWYSVSPGSFENGVPDTKNDAAYMKAYIGWVYACANAIAMDIAAARLGLYVDRGGGRLEEVAKSPLLDLAAKPNSGLTSLELQYISAVHIELVGESYWYLAKDGLGVPREIWPMYPQHMQPIPGKPGEGFITGYVFKPNSPSERKVYPADEIVYDRRPNPSNFYRGMGTLEAVRYAYDEDLSMRKTSLAAFQNRGRLDGYLKLPTTPNDAELNRLRDRWKEIYGGVEKAGGIGVLGEGADFVSLASTLAELEYMEGRRLTRDEICAWFGVPRSILGMTDDINLANAESNERTYMANTIKPKLEMKSARLTQDLAQREYDPKLVLKYDDPVPANMEERRAERESRLKSFETTINEERLIDNLEPVPYGDTPWVPFNLVQMGETAAAVSDDLAADAVARGAYARGETRPFDEYLAERADNEATRELLGIPGFEEDLRKAEEHVAGGMSVRFDGRKLDSEAKRKAAWLDFFVRLVPLERKLTSQVRVLFGAQRRAILAKLNDERAWSFDVSILAPEDVTALVFDPVKESQIWTEKLSPTMKRIVEAGVLRGSEELGISPFSIPPDGNVMQFVREKVFADSLKVNSYTDELLRKTLAEGYDAGESTPKIAERIRKVFVDADKTRALRIAQTETTSFFNYGTVSSYIDSGLPLLKEWLTSRRGNVRPSHAAMDGETAELDGLFRTGDGNWIAYPGDPDAPASEVVNCHCTTISVRKE